MHVSTPFKAAFLYLLGFCKQLPPRLVIQLASWHLASQSDTGADKRFYEMQRRLSPAHAVKLKTQAETDLKANGVEVEEHLNASSRVVTELR